MALTLAQLAASDPAVLAHLTNGGVASRPAAEKVTLFAEAAAVLLVVKPSFIIQLECFACCMCVSALVHVASRASRGFSAPSSAQQWPALAHH